LGSTKTYPIILAFLYKFAHFENEKIKFFKFEQVGEWGDGFCMILITPLLKFL